jgi:hypothetical protein
MRLASAIVVTTLTVGLPAAAAPPPDTLPPTKPTIDGQLRPTALRPVFTFGATDRRTPRGKIRFRCAFDGATLRPCARIHRPAAALAFGAHTLRVQALDLAGNASRVTSRSFVVVGRWDAAADFERAPRPANPGRDRYGNTVWFYLDSKTRNHDPAGYALLPTFAVLAPNWEVWYLLPDFASASVGYLNGKAVMHPGVSFPTGENAILAWRSPIAGDVRIRAELENEAARVCPVAGNGIRWSIDRGATSLRSGVVDAGGVTSSELTTTVAAGENLYLVVEDNGLSNCDSTGVELLIETT